MPGLLGIEKNETVMVPNHPLLRTRPALWLESTLLVDQVAELGSLEGHVLKQDDPMSDCCARAQQSKTRRRSDGIIDGNSCRSSGEQR